MVIDDVELECNCVMMMMMMIMVMVMMMMSVIAWWILVQGGAGQVDVQTQIPYSEYLKPQTHK